MTFYDFIHFYERLLCNEIHFYERLFVIFYIFMNDLSVPLASYKKNELDISPTHFFLIRAFRLSPLTSLPHRLIAPQGRVEGRPYKRCPFASKMPSAVRMKSLPSMRNFFIWSFASSPFASSPMFSTEVAVRSGSTTR